MESVAAAALLGLVVVAVIHAFNGGDSLKRWTDFVLTGRGPGRDVTKPSWGIVAGQVQSAAGDIAAGIGESAAEQQARAARAAAGKSTPADVAAESSLAGAAIRQGLPSFQAAPTRTERAAASAAVAASNVPGAVTLAGLAGSVAGFVGGSGSSHAQARPVYSWADNARAAQVAISDLVASVSARAKAGR